MSINIDQMVSDNPSNKARFGAILTFKQEWKEIGFSLGDLLYSLPLVPGEERKIATVDWQHKDYATRTTKLNESFSQDTTISRDEAVSEVVQANSGRHLTDDTNAYGGSLSIPTGTPLSLSGSASNTNEKMDESIDSKTTASRNISDTTRQASNAMRNTRSYSIVEVSESETSTAVTRVVRNYNHCHTVTYQYYEVLRNFIVSTKMDAIKPALFIPFQVIPDFGPTHLEKFGYLIRRALLDPTLQKVIDKFLNIDESGQNTPSTNPAPSGSSSNITTKNTPANPAPSGDSTNDDSDILTISVRFALSFTDAAGSTMVEWHKRSGSGGILSSTNYPIFTFILNEDTCDVQSNDKTVFNENFTNNTNLIGFQFKPKSSIKFSDIKKIGIINNISDEYTLLITDLNFSYQTSEGWQEFYRKASIDLRPTLRFVDYVGSSSVSNNIIDNSDTSRLFKHLNANPVYYTSAILSAVDNGLLYQMLSNITDPNNTKLSDLVDVTITGFQGNYICFPLRNLNIMPEELRATDTTWQHDEPDEQLISLPTQGVFAESQLGTCSACEVLDNTRFWDWQTSPIPDQAPDITPAMLASRFQDVKDILDVVKSDLVPQPVQIPTLPPPMIQIGDATMAELVKGLTPEGMKNITALMDLLSKMQTSYMDQLTKTVKSTPTSGSPSSAIGGVAASAGTDAAASAGAGDLAVTATEGLAEVAPAAAVAIV